MSEDRNRDFDPIAREISEVFSRRFEEILARRGLGFVLAIGPRPDEMIVTSNLSLKLLQSVVEELDLMIIAKEAEMEQQSADLPTAG